MTFLNGSKMRVKTGTVHTSCWLLQLTLGLHCELPSWGKGAGVGDGETFFFWEVIVQAEWLNCPILPSGQNNHIRVLSPQLIFCLRWWKVKCVQCL